MQTLSLHTGKDLASILNVLVADSSKPHERVCVDMVSETLEEVVRETF